VDLDFAPIAPNIVPGLTVGKNGAFGGDDHSGDAIKGEAVFTRFEEVVFFDGWFGGRCGRERSSAQRYAQKHRAYPEELGGEPHPPTLREAALASM
jgi:hypothetical protein